MRDDAGAKLVALGNAGPSGEAGIGDGVEVADGVEPVMPDGSPVVRYCGLAAAAQAEAVPREHTKLERVVATTSLIVVSLVVLLVLLLLARAVLTGTRAGLGLHRRNKPRPNRKVKSPVSAWEEAGRRLKVEPRGGEEGDEDDGWRDGPPGDGDGSGGHGGHDGPDDGESWRTGRDSDVTGDDLPPERRTK